MERVVIGDGEPDLASLNSEALKCFYQKGNSELTSSLLSGARLEDQQRNIRMLNKISEELNRRKPFSRPPSRV